MTKAELNYYIKKLDNTLNRYKQAGWENFTSELVHVVPQGRKNRAWATVVSFLIGGKDTRLLKHIPFHVRGGEEKNRQVFKAVQRLLKGKYNAD